MSHRASVLLYQLAIVNFIFQVEWFLRRSILPTLLSYEALDLS